MTILPYFIPGYKENEVDNSLDNSDDSIPDLEEFTDDEKEDEYFDCFVCKKRTKNDDDCYIIEIEENGFISSRLCGSCKKDNLKCKKCDKELDSDDIYMDEVKFLLYQFGKIENCISCLITTKQFIIKPNVNDLEIGKDNNENLDFESKYEDIYKKYRILKNINQSKEQQCSILIDQNETIILEKDKYKNKYETLLNKINKILEISNSQNIDDAIDTFSQIKKENEEFIKIIYDNEELTCPDDIPRIIKEKNKYKTKYKYIFNLFKENDILDNDNFLNFVKKYKNLEIFKNSEKNDPQEEINDEFFIEFKHNLKDYKLKKLLEKNKKIINDDPQFEKSISININELNSLHINISKSYINILDEIDVLEKEANEIEKVMPIFNKLKNNIDIINTLENEKDELSRLFSKLNNDKITEYITMTNIGKKIIEENLNDDYVNNHIKFFNDRKGRIILKCKRIYLLSKYINIESIALSGISHFIRDSHINTFNCLLNLLKTNPN